MSNSFDTEKVKKLMLDRRAWLGGAALLGLGWVAWNKPAEKGADHTDYFKQLSSALEQDRLARPTLVIDRKAFHHNVDTLTSHLPTGMNYRIVVKSLPSLPLVQDVMARAQTNRLMVFHQPFLNAVARQIPNADMLLGKPMPVAAAARFYDHLSSGDFNPAKQVQWLIDSEDRFRQYKTLAASKNIRLQMNFEIDVGLHRGGLTEPSQLAKLLTEIAADDRLSFSGLMGYEPHLAGIPTSMGWQTNEIAKSRSVYQSFIDVVKSHFDDSHAHNRFTFNAAGSPTYQHYNDTEIANELSVGSALVKPTDFDISTLADHVPASYIATPVIKSLDVTRLPALDTVSSLMAAWDPNKARTFFIYGGKWMAKPVSPAGLQLNPIYGRSTNQEMFNGSNRINLKPDDYVFFRPKQSEFVFLQFGDIAVYENGKISDRWSVFNQEA